MVTQISTLFPGKNVENPDYVNIIRTDASFATRVLRQNIVKNTGVNPEEIKSMVNAAYAVWGTKVVTSLKHCSATGEDARDSFVDDGCGAQYSLHDAQKLASIVINNAYNFVEDGGKAALLVSLDDIITSIKPDLDDIAFSRLFSIDGCNYYDYVARPGYPALDQQFETLRNTIDGKVNALGVSSIPIVLLEDNVRHARMLTWLFKQMDDYGIFEKSEVVGISSCFCCASRDEQSKLIFNDKVVPVVSVVEYNGAKIDVITPRDLMFDGFVVDINGENCRLPGVFMDVCSRFNIDKRFEKRFLSEVIEANIDFCGYVEQNLGVTLPLSWFATARAISHVTQMEDNTPMKKVMENQARNRHVSLNDQPKALRRVI